MNKIVTLAKQGWHIEIHTDSEKNFYVTFSHSFWGDATGYGETLPEAINNAYEKYKELDPF